VNRARDEGSPKRRGPRPESSRIPRRQLTDAREIRAVAHPLRIALLEALGREGPLTATEAGELLGESPANMSFHLRTLAKYGFVEEAPGGTGRQRPWRRVTVGHAFDLDSEETAAAVAAQTLSRHVAARALERRVEWEANRTSFPKRWRDSSFAFDSLVYLTAAELEAVGHELLAIIDRYSDRIPDRAKRPEGAYPVAIVAHGHPLPPSPSGN
jgi:DNA-binding transcriptional ArsR family regulator